VHVKLSYAADYTSASSHGTFIVRKLTERKRKRKYGARRESSRGWRQSPRMYD
jgi:hypothetical protein